MSKIDWRVDSNTHVVVRKPLFREHRVFLNGQRVHARWRAKTFPLALPGGRYAEVRLKADALSRQVELSVDGKVIPDTRYVPKDLRCPACHAEIELLDEFCGKCGHRLGTPDRFLNQRSIRSATTAIIVLAVLYALFGVVMYFALQKTTDAALANLAQFADDEVLQPIDGVTYTAGELRKQVVWQHRGILVVNLILSGLMLALAWWSRHKPLAAILIATAIFVVVQVVSAIIEPETLVRGIILKIVIIAVLIRGIKGALSLRAEHG